MDEYGNVGRSPENPQAVGNRQRIAQIPLLRLADVRPLDRKAGERQRYVYSTTSENRRAGELERMQAQEHGRRLDNG